MQNEESQKWWAELEEEPKVPDPEVRECCMVVFFGELEQLWAELHIGKLHGRYLLNVNYCPHCGRDMNEYRKVAKEKIKKHLEL